MSLIHKDRDNAFFHKFEARPCNCVRAELEAALKAAAVSPPDEARRSVVLAADEYAQRCADATGRGFDVGELVNLKAWFYAGARWAARTRGADVVGPQSSTMAAAVSPPDHDFQLRDGYDYPFCVVCGIVQRRDGKNQPCKGPTRVALRDDPAVSPAPQEAETK